MYLVVLDGNFMDDNDNESKELVDDLESFLVGVLRIIPPPFWGLVAQIGVLVCGCPWNLGPVLWVCLELVSFFGGCPWNNTSTILGSGSINWSPSLWVSLEPQNKSPTILGSS